LFVYPSILDSLCGLILLKPGWWSESIASLILDLPFTFHMKQLCMGKVGLCQSVDHPLLFHWCDSALIEGIRADNKFNKDGLQ
jgi:hypothetical protein